MNFITVFLVSLFLLVSISIVEASSSSFVEVIKEHKYDLVRSMIEKDEVDLMNPSNNDGKSALYHAIKYNCPVDIINSLKPSIDSNSPELNHEIIDLLAMKRDFDTFLSIINSDFFKTTSIPFSDTVFEFIENLALREYRKENNNLITRAEEAFQNGKIPLAIKNDKRVQLMRLKAFKSLLLSQIFRNEPFPWLFENPFLIAYIIYTNSRCDLEMVKFLIEQGVDMNAQNKYGETAVIYAIDNEKYDIAEYLLELGARVNVEPLMKVIEASKKDLSFEKVSFSESILKRLEERKNIE